MSCHPSSRQQIAQLVVYRLLIENIMAVFTGSQSKQSESPQLRDF